MSATMQGLWLRIRRILGSSSAAHDIDDELRFHVDMETEAYVRQGMTPDDARRLALASFGGQAHWREETHGARGTAWLEDAVRDARIALRGLRRSPAFSIVALATMTLGVGATTAVFSVVNGVVFSSLPYPRSEELVSVWMRNPAQGIEKDVTSWPNFVDWRSAGTSMRGMAVVREVTHAVTGGGDPEEVTGAEVSRGFFDLIGAPLALGRGFRDDEVEGNAVVRVVVLSHQLFTRRFGADPSLVGRTIQLNGEAWQVVGVAAPGARYPPRAELWVPIHFADGRRSLAESRSALWLPVIGRLGAGATRERAQRELDVVAQRLAADYPANEGIGIRIEPLRETLVGEVRGPLLVLLGAVGLVMLIAVVNVGNLLLVRGARRRRELALRFTLGAGRGRIVRQLLMESVLLGGAGGVAGAVVASLAIAAFVATGAVGLPRLDELGVDVRVLGVAFAVAVGSSVLFGLLPALHGARVDPATDLREGTRGSSVGGLARVRAAFVSGQFALALLVLVLASLLVRSFMNLRAVEPGFDATNVVSATVSLPPARYQDDAAVRAFNVEVERRLAAIPGVGSVGTVSTFFLSSLPTSSNIVVDGRLDLVERTRERPVVEDASSPGFFAATGMKILAGRGITSADGVEAARVAVVNQTFVRIYLHGMNPIGRRFVWGGIESGVEPPWITVVGVVADARRAGLDQPVRPSAFQPLAQAPTRRMDFLVRSARSGADPLAIVPALRRAIADVDDQLPLTQVRTLDQALSQTLAQRRLVVSLLSAFAAAALALAAIGIFGVMAYVVAQRRREIGIRVALGAPRERILRTVLAEALVHAGIGLAVGATASLALTRMIRSQLFGLGASDPVTYVGATAVLVATALLACWVPARRAARVDPMVALGAE